LAFCGVEVPAACAAACARACCFLVATSASLGWWSWKDGCYVFP
jgi:hypothetical protein